MCHQNFDNIIVLKSFISLSPWEVVYQIILLVNVLKYSLLHKYYYLKDLI
jgi:hypothetical protein